MQITITRDHEIKSKLFEGLPKLLDMHHEYVTLPILGWFLAAPFAQKIREKYFGQFPLLCVGGRPGCGKTSILRALNQVLYGIHNEYSATATLAVLRRVLMSTNAFPVYIDEYDAKQTHKYTELDTYFRLAYQAGSSPFFDVNSRSILELVLQAPICVSGTTGFEDDALADRSVNVRIESPFTQEHVENFYWFKEFPPGIFLEHWLSTPSEEWIANIKNLKTLVRGCSDRQQMAFAAMAAPLVHLADQLGEKFNPGKLVNIWLKQTSRTEDHKEDVLHILDSLLARVARLKGEFLEGMHYKVDGGTIKIHQALAVDTMLRIVPEMQFKTNVTRKWIQTGFADLITTGEVIEKNKVTKIEGRNVACLILRGDKFPLLMQEISL